MPLKYHINPATGNANICRADASKPRSRGCAFAQEGVEPPHYENKEEAREAYESEASLQFEPQAVSRSPKSKRTKSLTALHQPHMHNEAKSQEILKNMHEEFQTMEESLDKDESYTLSMYTFTLSSELNRYHHGIELKYHNNDEGIDFLLKSTKIIDEIFEKVEKREKTRKLYRYVVVPKGKTPEAFANEIIKNGNYSDSGYMSTTEDLSYIAGLAHHRSDDHKIVILELETNRGISLQSEEKERVGTIQSFEKERLLPRNMEFTIVDSGKSALKIHDSRLKLREQFAGGYLSDWTTGERHVNSIPKRSFHVISMRDNSIPTEDSIDENPKS